MQPIKSPLTPFKLERYFARWEFAAPYLMCASDIEGYRMADLLALADGETRTLWETLTLGYTETTGHPLLREAIAGLYKSVQSDDIMTFAGAEEAIYIAMRVLLHPGDHMIVSFPGYQSSYQIAEDIGISVSRWMITLKKGLDGQDHWQIDVDALREMIRPNTRLILVNFPHNPTGMLPTQNEWAEIVAVAKACGCYLFSDEVYRLLEYNPSDRLPAAVDVYERGLSLGVMSKPFGLAGLRVGWLAAHDQALLNQFAVYKDYTTICSSAPSEILALVALRAKDRVLERCLNILRANLALATEVLPELTEYIEWIPPKAGSIAFPRWVGPGRVEQFTDKLVQKAGVLLLPGTVYDYPGEYFRLGLGRENFPAALDHLQRFFKSGYQPQG